MSVWKSKRSINDEVLQHAIRRARLGVWDWDLRADRCSYSDGWFEMLGYHPGELRQTSDLWIKLVHPDDRERAIASGDLHLAGAVAEIETELRLRHKDGRWIWVLDRGGIIERDADGRPVRMVGVQTDITSQKRIAAELLEVNERFRLALEASDIGIWQFDPDTQLSFWDNRTREIFGLPPGSAELPRGLWHQFLHPDDKQAAEKAHSETTEKTQDIRYRIVRADGTIRHLETLARFVPVLGTSGLLTGTIRDVTEEHERQQQLAWTASHDALTGLLNRAKFEAVLAERIAAAIANPVHLLYIDLDYFKAINDSAGHAAGDLALKNIANGLVQIAPSAAVARLGGDEFAIVLAESDGDARQIAEQILGVVKAVALGSGHKTEMGASIGIAEISDTTLSVADALARADDACYASKVAGRNQWSVFDEHRPHWSGLTAARLVSDIADAKVEGRLKLFGQEIHRINDPFGSADHVEVLARLYSRDGKLILPGEFIPAAERFGVASALDRWIIRSALQQCGPLLGDVSIGFNLSAHTLSDPTLWDFVEEARAAAGAPSSGIFFEITETAAFTDLKAAEAFLNRARSKGYRIALDDFGAGLSSFSYLRKFPVDVIKIDGSFIERVTDSPLDREAVSSLCRIASVLGCELIAERIENQETLTVLSELGVRLGQGFLMHRPEPLPGLMERLVPAGQGAVTAPA